MAPKKEKDDKQKAQENNEKHEKPEEEKQDDDAGKQPPSDRSWIKNDYKKLKQSLQKQQQTALMSESGRGLNAYADTSVSDTAMNTSTKPVKVEPYGLRPGEAIAKEYGRDSTLKPVDPQKSLQIDSGFPMPYKPQNQKKEATAKNKEKEQNQNSEKTADENKQKSDSTKKKDDGKKNDKQNKEKQNDTNKNNEQEKDDQEDKKKEPHYMRIPYQLPRERRVVFKPLKILEQKRKDQLNYDDLRKIRKEVEEQKQERSAVRYEENYTLTQRDWKDMEFDGLYDLRLEADKKRLQKPIVRYFGAYKRGNREAATELAQPLDPTTADELECKKLDTLLNNLQKT
ncbi:cylicin-1-like [Symsagittifera roscoffensis]|uniref:cylicin-1-like n=1 Tax=Symsagittifera roscoffensis TaxID=84072 RepID=UPI00307C9010